MSLLSAAFETAFCTTTVRPGDTVTCGCGTSHKSTIEKPLRSGEGPGGYLLVAGCGCDYPESFGGMMFRYRVEICAFLREMAARLKAQSDELIDKIPEGDTFKRDEHL